MQVHPIVYAHPFKRTDKAVRRSHQIRSVAVGRSLVSSGYSHDRRVQERHELLTSYGYYKQSGVIMLGIEAEGVIKRVPIQHQRRQVESPQGDSFEQNELLEDVFALEVADLVRQHGRDFIHRVRVDERVVQDDPLGPSPSPEKYALVWPVRLSASIWKIPARGIPARSADAPDRIFQGPLIQRGEFVEKRSDHGGVIPP